DAWDDRRLAYCTAWMRLIMSAYLAPYLSHTGLTASWKGFLSASFTGTMPAAFIVTKASAATLFHNTRSSAWVSFDSLRRSAWSSLDNAFHVFFEKTSISGTMRCSVSV